MRSTVLAITLIAATAGFARAETTSADQSVSVRVAGLTPQAARAALRAAAHQVCTANDALETTSTSDCYNATLRVALNQLKKAERAPTVSGGTETASR
jgi:hypothetical protein